MRILIRATIIAVAACSAALTATAEPVTIDFNGWQPTGHADAGQITGTGLEGPHGEKIFYFNGTWSAEGAGDRRHGILTVPTVPNGTYHVDFHEDVDKDVDFTTDENGQIAVLKGNGVHTGTISRTGPSALRINTVGISWKTDANRFKIIAKDRTARASAPAGSCVLPIGKWQVNWWGMRDHGKAQPITEPPGFSGDYRLAFVTSTTRNAVSSTIGDYDTHVTNAANAVTELAALSTTWSVIGSTATVDARDHTGTNPSSTGVPIYGLDGLKIADNNADLWDQSIDKILEITDQGLVNALAIVYTGTDRDGTKEVGFELGCSLCGTGQEIAAYGASNRADLGWIKETTISGMNTPRPFYAISGVLNIVSEAPEENIDPEFTREFTVSADGVAPSELVVRGGNPDPAILYLALSGRPDARNLHAGRNELDPRKREESLHLLLDSRIVDTVSGAQLKVGTVAKHPANPFFGKDKPWEVSLDNLYPNVVYDDQVGHYKCWYGNYRPLDRYSGGFCYAQSEDGVAWHKPELGLINYKGSKENNIVFWEGGGGGGVSLDRYETDPAKRFKMFYITKTHEGPMATRFSPDGIHWGEENVSAVKPRGDTHNNAFWAPTLGKYVGITRGWVDPWKERLVQRMESTDFVDWTAPVTVLHGDEKRQTYSMPVFYYGGVYLGLPSILMYDNGMRVQTELAWSSDTVNWHRIEAGTPLIPCSEKKGDYDWGIIYSAAVPIIRDNEIRLYYGGGAIAHIGTYDASLCLATLRPDGFAGYQPQEKGTIGVVTTRPVTCSAARLRISADAQGGAVRISVLDDEGRPLGQSQPITSDVTDGEVSWQDDFDLAGHLGGYIRLRFELENATIYAFRLGDGARDKNLQSAPTLIKPEPSALAEPKQPGPASSAAPGAAPGARPVTINFNGWRPRGHADAGQITGPGLEGPGGEKIFYFNGTWNADGVGSRRKGILTVPTVPNEMYHVDFHEGDDKDVYFTTDEDGHIGALEGNGVRNGTVNRIGPSALQLNTVEIVWRTDADRHKIIAKDRTARASAPAGSCVLPIGKWQVHWWGMRDYGNAPAENIDLEFTVIPDGVEPSELIVRGGTPDPAILYMAVSSQPVERTLNTAESEKKIKKRDESLYLLLDSRIVDTVSGAQLKVGTVAKHPANPLFNRDKPWEVSLNGLYPNVVYDDQAKRYRCWYVIEGGGPGYYDGLCYAESKDGMAWHKPALGLVDYKGSKDNNIVFENGHHGVGVFLDRHETDPANRFKMIFKAIRGTNFIATRFSSDGIHWGGWEDVNVSSQTPAADTHNNAFWAPTLGKYVGITRGWIDPRKERLVQRMESTNFVDWTAPVTVLHGDEKRQTYSMPVFHYGGVYLGLPAILMYDNGMRVQTELAWSPDTVNWHRIEAGTPLIPCGKKKGDYDWGMVYSAVVPIFRDNKIRLYYGGDTEDHEGRVDSALCLATLRPDGFAGYQPTEKDTVGVVTTRPVTCSGAQLRISADAQDGAVRISVVDDAGRQVGRAQPVTVDVTDGVIWWQDGFELAGYLGKDIRLRFELENATIYAFGFEED